MNKPTFLIVSVYDGGSHPPDAPTYAELAKHTSKSLIDYCNSNNYNYLITDEYRKIRAASWAKVDLARLYLQDYDFVWCIDNDVMIMNQNIPLDSIVDQNHDVFFTCYYNDINHLNTGSIIYRNSEWTQNFLKEIWADEEFVAARPNCFFEQSAIIKWYKNHPEEQGRFKFLPVRAINSHYHQGFNGLNINYEKGDLAVHLAGTDNFYRLEAFTEFEKFITSKGKDVQNFNVKIWDK